MSESPNKLSQFWQELKRRRVAHVITVYASAAFVIIELINNLTEPLNLPLNLLTIVVIVLAVGFPLAIILSWLYDVTAEGVEKTKPIKEVTKKEKTVVPNAWKIATYVSFVVIVGLAVLNIVGGGKQLRAGDIQSLVILPFENNTGEDQFENMVSSMHSLLCGDMGRISGLRVIGKTTSKIYKEVDMSAKDIARELNVDAVVEATVMCLGDTVCMQFSLVSTTGEEDQIWIGDYREDKGQILNLYNRITKQIAKEVKIELSVDEERLLARSRTVDREAFDAYLRGSYYLDDGSEESLMKAREYLSSAVEKDPEWAPLYTGLTMVWLSIAQTGYESPEIAGPKIFENLNKALELDPDLADSHFVSGMMAYLTDWNWENGEKEFLKALSINPNDAQTRVFYAQLLSILQRSGEALTQGQLAIDQDPLNPLIQVLYSALLVSLDDCEAALVLPEDIVAAADPEHVLAYNIIELAAYRCKDYNRTFEAVMNILPLEEDSLKEIEAIFDEHGFVAAYEEIMHLLEALALNSYVVPVEMAYRYVMANQYDKAIDWVEKGYELHDPNMPYIATSIYNLDPLHDNPRFIAIVEKMNLPMKKD